MIGIKWVGTDGSVWDLRGGPVRTTLAGIQGLAMPEVDDQVRETALMDGQRLTGWKLKPRSVWLPLKFHDVANTDVEGVQRAFWASLAIGQVGTLTITDGSGATRSIDLRFQDDGGVSYGLDPYIWHAPFGITFVADSPWWYGPAQTSYYSLGDTATQTFFGNGAGAPTFYILPNQGASATTLNNPGDQPAWIEWTIQGPLTAFRLGVDGHFVGGPIAVPTGSLLTIETDPLRQLAFLDGTKVTRQLTEVDFAPIPVGTTVPVSIDVTGLGKLTATIYPRYARAL